MRATSLLGVVLAVALAAPLGGCGGDGGSGTPDGGVQRDGPPPDVPAPTSLVFTTATIDDANAGHQPDMVRAPDGSLAVAYFRQLATQGSCTRLDPPVPVSSYEVVYAAEQADGSFVKEVVDTIDLLTLEGLSLAFDDAGNPGIAVMGGEEGQYRCGGSDIMLYTRSGAGTWSSATADGAGFATPVFEEDVTCCADYQNYCNAAAQDTVGPWPSLAFCGGEALIIYRDIHFGGWAQDDEAKSDLEMARGTSSFSLETLDATCGAGTYSKILVDDACNPSIAHYNRFIRSCDDCGRSSSGIWVQWYDSTGWHRQNVVPNLSVGYKLGFARVGPKHGLAYYPPRQGRESVEQRLWYVGSDDGILWDDPEVVDAQGDTGRTPSLAFDPAGRPAIAYYRCRQQYDPSSVDCNPNKDGVRFAVRDGSWQAVDVKNDPGGFDGLYVSLAFDRDGLPAIAYQVAFVDPTSNETLNHLIIARSKVQ